ncbi:hypothetical protein ATO12_22980 [Aquimarina atlantica]|uniref:Uncharacterized protein n=1 Tax=Aquimarina atlantica TaxID=1317122 RepID=A0A023BQV1_9FLAO|nr:hypothetical protein ATO12_22980 [Aquimarina atlantica]
MGKNVFRFLFLFTIVIAGTYLIHMGIINAFLLERNINIIKLSYIFNSTFTFVFTFIILLLSKKFKDQLGFIFMAGSLIKIGVFIAISKLSDFEINKNVFLDFFIAYLICLILEVYYLSKILNSNK